MTKLSLIVAVGFGFATLTPSLKGTAQPGPLLSLHVAATGRLLTNKLTTARTDETIIHFCGENVPINHPAIVDRWTRTLNHQAALAADLALLKRRASVVFPLIEPILEQYQIPSDFKFLPLLESAVTNRAVSRKGAAGFWQLMPGTAQTLGLTVSYRNDERFNLLKATHAACRYIVELHDLLGSWMLVATAYNAGPNYIQQLVRQHPAMHPMALPYRAAETKAYLFQAVAIKELLTRPAFYHDQLSSEEIDALTDDAEPLETAERAAILASFDMDETMVEKALAKRPVAVDVPFISDSTTTVVLLTEEESTAGISSKTPTTSGKKAQPAPVISAQEAKAPAATLRTRSMSDGVLTEGKLCLFQVIQPVTLNGRPFAVGDMIRAYIDVIDARSGRVYLRTDQLTTAQTREVFPLKMVATEQPKQPGVSLPNRLENWQLSWESL
ncbi:lytic transglycosylase domain-containing protein [Spirosoma spitsbergense]|uniref:lytic transglycosylase domain-containing protein n=1 Tax=Spirosoma spitsbergense TaxID=431554 RepID=UPI00036F9F16|nr:lytic transglycosylase domain-containing protein [Spirosoma spitsbergense]